MKEHIREAQKKKAYDPKKSVWVPNADKEVGGYFEGISEEEIKYDTFAAGKKLQVNVKGEMKTYKADTVCQVNPAKVSEPQDCNISKQILIASSFSLTALRIWLISPSSVTPAFSGTLSSGTRTS